MYIVSRPKGLLHTPNLFKQEGIFYPAGYQQFLEQNGAGTFRGWMDVYPPDGEVLKPFAQYDLWEHDEDSPISQEQIQQCIAIGTSVDGDFLAVYLGSNQLLWLPRHGERITAFHPVAENVEDTADYALLLDELYFQIYGARPMEVAYYEPWSETRNHFFLRLPPGDDRPSLQELSAMCGAVFPPDLKIENEYGCRLFHRELGGYIRFNYANRQEVALFYENSALELFETISQWLISKGCQV
ncbi:hypothetical protein ACX93W_14895 [Paenibacillus sp. CAU 1782]